MGTVGRIIGGVAGGTVGTLVSPGLGTAVGSTAGQLIGGGTEDLLRARKDTRQATQHTHTTERVAYTRTRGGMYLAPVQVQSMATIIDVFTRYQWPFPLHAGRAALALAAVANAYAESALKPDAVGDNGWSIGLFQCNRKAGAGVGHTVENLNQPRYNTVVILRETLAQRAVFTDLLLLGTTPETLAAAFSTYVERPADKPGEEVRRRKICRDLFGDMAVQPIQVPR